MYYIKYEALAFHKSFHSLYIFVTLKLRTSYCLTKHIKLSIHINLLCNNLISIIHAKIVSCSHIVSSYQT